MDAKMDADIIIVGAGFSGAVSAYNLTKQGIKTIVIDRSDVYPNAFRAEKIEPSQADALRRLSMLKFRLPSALPLGETINYRDGIISRFDTVEQYGINYSDTVNNFRKQLQPDTEFICARVTDLKLSADLQTVFIEDRELKCRLVILATGGKDTLLKKVGISRRKHPSLASLNLAFNLAPTNDCDFKFNGFNYFLTDTDHGIDYITIFKIGETMRANLFTQWNSKLERIKAFKKSPQDEMNRYFPDLPEHIGDFTITSKVQVFLTQFYRLHNLDKPGIIVIGDDYQSVSPATGSGLDKVLTDVERLCLHHVPKWLKTNGMDSSKIGEYYRDKLKQHCDDDSLEKWISYRDNHRGFLGRQASKLEIRINKYLDLW